MSMILYLKRVSASDIARLMSAPEATFGFLFPDVDVPDTAPADLEFDTYGFDDEFDCGKLWHALHFLLTGSVDGGDLPAGSLLLAGHPLDCEMGYGPPMAISPEDTRAFSNHLAKLSREVFLERVDPHRMTELQIYPDIWDEDRAELQAGIGAYFDALRSYCRKCADDGLGVIRVLT